MNASLKLIVLGGVLLATGCHNKNDTSESYMNQFVPEGDTRRVHEIAAAQASVGDRADGTLYAWHFDGKDLSPLGRDKLTSIVEADSLDTIKIYVDVKSDTFADRQKSVVAFLQDKGIAGSHLKVIEGINESTLTPSAPGIAAYGKTDTSVEASAGSSSGGSAATAAAK